MPTEKMKKSDDLELIDEILSWGPAICWTTPEGMEQLTDSDSSRLLRLARLGALVEMMPEDWDLEQEKGTWEVTHYPDTLDWETLSSAPTPTAALEAALGLGEEG